MADGTPAHHGVQKLTEVEQERATEAELAERLAQGAERAAQEIARLKQENAQLQQRVGDLEQEETQLFGNIDTGHQARERRISRMNQGLEALRRAGVLGLALLVIGGAGLLGLYYRGAPASERTVGEVPKAPFLLSLTA